VAQLNKSLVQQQKILKKFSANGYPLRNSTDRSQRLVSWYFGWLNGYAKPLDMQ